MKPKFSSLRFMLIVLIDWCHWLQWSYKISESAAFNFIYQLWCFPLPAHASRALRRWWRVIFRIITYLIYLILLLIHSGPGKRYATYHYCHAFLSSFDMMQWYTRATTTYYIDICQKWYKPFHKNWLLLDNNNIVLINSIPLHVPPSVCFYPHIMVDNTRQ